jgi:hypothetical protein
VCYDIRVIFTDIQIPGSMNGLKLAHAVRHRWPPVHIVATSAYQASLQDEWPAGSVFLLKPYTEREIVDPDRELPQRARWPHAPDEGRRLQCPPLSLSASHRAGPGVGSHRLAYQPARSLIDAPRQSTPTKLLRTTIFAAMIITPRHRLAILIVARFPHRLSRYIQPERDIPIQGSHSTRAGEEAANPSPPIEEETMTANEGNVVTEQPVAEPEAPAPTEPQPTEPVAEQPPAEQAAESPAEQSAPTSDDAPTS